MSFPDGYTIRKIKEVSHIGLTIARYGGFDVSDYAIAERAWHCLNQQ
ncbi:MAG: hypothetical protein QX199_18870 [Methylococcaceae bacterium]